VCNISIVSNVSIVSVKKKKKLFTPLKKKSSCSATKKKKRVSFSAVISLLLKHMTTYCQFR